MKIHYKEIETDESQIKKLEIKFDDRIENLKTSSIKYLSDTHPEFYREALVFDDWESSMKYLQENREIILQFWRKYD
tara:strand:+ start:2025 stop:2255 length:231 start_codon:yes stop_codon:yes gene_type:complete